MFLFKAPETLSVSYLFIYMFSSNPIPKYKHEDDDPPALKNGKVTPITGRTNKHMPKLNIV